MASNREQKDQRPECAEAFEKERKKKKKKGRITEDLQLQSENKKEEAGRVACGQWCDVDG